MLSLRLLFVQLGVAGIVAGLHIYGMAHFYYWLFPWYDIPAHLFGGLWAGLFAYWVAVKIGKEPSVLLCIAAAFLIGVIWELFEFLTGITNFPIEILDALGDISMDALGGLLGYLLARRINKT